jgi:hypothetical protein
MAASQEKGKRLVLESFATFTLNFNEVDHLKWKALIDGLAQNRQGAYLEEYAEAFGETAVDMVEYLLDVWEEERGEIDTSGSTLSVDKAIIHIAGYGTVEPSVRAMTRFLKACGATQVEVVIDLDSERC